MILADYVKCNNCEEIMYVVKTTEVCPNCLERGTLSFVDENNPEVEVSEWVDRRSRRYSFLSMPWGLELICEEGFLNGWKR